MIKNVLVTGAAGFIGSFLCEKLLESGYKVYGVDNYFRGKRENIDLLKKYKNFIFYELDLSLTENVAKLRSVLQENKVTILFHLAAINGTQYFYDHSWFVLDQNTRITQNTLQAIEHSDVKHIIYTSSSEVYGEPLAVPTNEKHPILLNALADRDSYAASKAIGEFYVKLFSEKHGINALILRVFNMYGERMVNTKYGQVIPEFINRMLLETEFTIIGNGQHTRSFCYIKDAVDIMVRLMQREISGILNLGNNEEIKIISLAEKIHQLGNRKFYPIFLPERADDHHRRCPEIYKLLDLLPGFQWTSLEQGLPQVIEFQKAQL